MPAAKLPVTTATFVASGALTAGKLVKLSNAETIVLNAAATTLPVGVTETDIADGATGSVQMSGVVRCTAGAAFPVGTRLMSDGTGRVITLTAAATARVECVGVALSAAIAANDTVLVQLSFAPFTMNTV